MSRRGRHLNKSDDDDIISSSPLSGTTEPTGVSRQFSSSLSSMGASAPLLLGGSTSSVGASTPLLLGGDRAGERSFSNESLDGHRSFQSEAAFSVAKSEPPPPPLEQPQQHNLLIGRESERTILQQAYERVCCRVQQAPSEIVLLEGSSGVGKTQLVRQTLTELMQEHDMGLWATGKYNFVAAAAPPSPSQKQQLASYSANTENGAICTSSNNNNNHDKSNAPYAALVDAATELCQTVVESECYRKDVRAHLKEVLGHIGDEKLLANLFPAVKLLLGKSRSSSSTTTTHRSGIDHRHKNNDDDDDGDDHHHRHHRHPTEDPETLADVADDSSTTTTATSNTPVPSHEFALRRFLQVFCTFWKAVASVHPVILFLDDLQWADAASKAFLMELAADISCTNLLLIGAYRTGQFDDFENILLKQQQQQHQQQQQQYLRITKIPVGPLSQSSINKIVARATHRLPDETTELGELVHRRTDGNVYFCWQFLDMLQATGLLQFSFRSNHWEWKPIEVIAERTNVSDNVGTLLTQKITRLSPRTQTILMLASCLGHSFHFETLEQIALSEDLLPLVTCAGRALSSREEIREHFEEAINEAIQEGLLEPCSKKEMLKFCHDRVQQIFFSVVPDGISLEYFHSLLGRRLYELSDMPDGKVWMRFAAVDLLTESKATMDTSPYSKVQLAFFCLEASYDARSMSAFITAAAYADKGYSLLDASIRWNAQYALCLELRQLSAEMHHSYGNHDCAIQATSDIICRSRDIHDRLSAYRVVISTLFALRDFHGAIEKCSTLLKELGVSIPTKANKLDVAWNLLRVRALLRGRGAADLMNLPHMEDPTIVFAGRVLNEMALAAWMTDEQDLSTLASLTMMRVTLIHGISQYSPASFAVFGCTLSHLGHYEQAYEFGCLALQSEEKYGNKETMPRTFLVTHAFLHHLRQPILTSLQPLEQAYENGMQTGVLTVAGQCLAMRASLGIHGNTSLDYLEAQIRGYLKFFKDYQLSNCFPLVLPIFQLVLNLSGKARDPLVLIGEALDETVFADQHAKLKSLVPRVILQNCRMTLLVVLDALEVAERELKRPRLHAASTHYLKCCDFFFCALAYFGLARKHRRKSQRYQRRARKYQQQLEKFVNSGSVNCLPFSKLLDAESMSLNKHASHERVLRTYQDAIGSAARCGFRMYKGLACEKAGQYLLDKGDRVLACEYLQDAWIEYADYGALAKLSQMQLSYKDAISFHRSNSASLTPPAPLTS